MKKYLVESFGEGGKTGSPKLLPGLKNFIIDIDGVVCEDIPNEEPERMITTAEILGSKEQINRWFDEGHIITFFTSRTDDLREITENWLKNHGFKFHNIIFGKPRGGNYHYIDDKEIMITKFNGNFADIMKEGIQVSKIENGTVIDHIPAGIALTVLKILGISGKKHSTVSVLMNAKSGRVGQKDIVKIADRFLKKEEYDKIALIAPNATINIIKNFKVSEKFYPKPPAKIGGIIRCGNSVCITNQPREKISHSFSVESTSPLKIKCDYCSRIMSEKDVIEQLTLP